MSSVANVAGTLEEYNDWIELQSAWMSERNKTVLVHDLLGFFMGFRKDQPIADFTDNILLRGGRNLHQGRSAPLHCRVNDATVRPM